MNKWQIALIVWIPILPLSAWAALMVYAVTGWTIPVHEPEAFWFALGLVWLASLPLADFLLDD